jgi:hypothetical protein
MSNGDNNKDKEKVEVEKAGRIGVREDTTIRSNDILQGLLRVGHLDGKRRGRGYLAVPLSFFYGGGDPIF